MEVGKYLIQGGKVAGKRCTKCQQVLPLDQFSRKEKGSNRLKSHCKACVRARSQAHYLRNVDDYVQRSAARKTELRQRARQVRDAFLSGKRCEVCAGADLVRVVGSHGRGASEGVSPARGLNPWGRLQFSLADSHPRLVRGCPDRPP